MSSPANWAEFELSIPRSQARARLSISDVLPSPPNVLDLANHQEFEEIPIKPMPYPKPDAIGPSSLPLEDWKKLFPPDRVMPINFPTALRLAQTQNLAIAQARQVMEQARAGLERARVQILPTVSLGSTFVDHEGRIQQAVGNILNTNRNSLFVGGGPSVAFQMNEAIFTPLAARQLAAASEAGWQRVTNDTLLAVAETYFTILRARRRLARVEDTLDFLASEKPSASRGNSKGLYPVIRDLLKAGAKEALKADLTRVQAEILRRREEGRAALQELHLATAELARLLRLDPQVILWPIEDNREGVPLPGSDWLELPVEELVGQALRNRPEIAENEAVVQAALNRLKAARMRPLLPAVVLNYNVGGFGGSPNFLNRVPGVGLGIGSAMSQSGRIDQFGSRSDFDVSLVWRLNNLGFGNQAEVREQRSLHAQAQLRNWQIQDQIMTQVVQAHELVHGGRERLGITRSALFDDKGQTAGPIFESLRLNFARIRQLEIGRALETLDSIRGLNDLLETYALALTDLERAHFRLLFSLGLTHNLANRVE